MTARRTAGFAAIAASLVIAAAGCAAARPAGVGPGARPPPELAASSVHRLAAAYLAVARPANRKLDKAENGYTAHCRTDLAAAETALRDQAAIEHGFDRRLAAIAFPPAVAATAGALIRVNQIRIAFTLRQAGAGSGRALLADTAAHHTADAQVEAQIRVIRAELGLPPPSSS